MQMEIAKLLTLEETAEILRRSPSQLRWLLTQNRAPKSALIGGRRMFRDVDVADYIEAAFKESDK